MSFQGVELEIRVPCTNGEEHPVRVRYTDWDAISCEVVYNPCQEKAHDSPDSPPPCIEKLQDKQVYKDWRKKSIYEDLWEKPTHRLALLRGLSEEKDPAAAQMLLKALEDPDPTVAFTAAELLGNFPGDPTISEALVEKIISILQSLYQFENKRPRVDKDGRYYETSRPVPKRHYPAWEESSLRVTFEAAASALIYVGIPDRFLQAKLRAAIHQLIAPYGEVYFYARYKEYNLNASIDFKDIDSLIMMERVLSVLRSVLSVVGSLGDVPVFAAAGMPMEEEDRLGILAKHWHKLSEEQKRKAMQAMRAFKIFWQRWHLLNTTLRLE